MLHRECGYDCRLWRPDLLPASLVTSPAPGTGVGLTGVGSGPGMLVFHPDSGAAVTGEVHRSLKVSSSLPTMFYNRRILRSALTLLTLL